MNAQWSVSAKLEALSLVDPLVSIC